MTTSQASYYHVRITPKSNPSATEVQLDLSEQDLLDRFVHPYARGLPIVVAGTSIPSGEIDRIRINRTTESSSTINSRVRPRLERSLPLDHRLRLPSIVLADQGDEVTVQYITGPPGHEASPVNEASQPPRPSEGTREVFVVHGRNAAAREAMFQFLRAIGLHPLEWSEAVRRTGRPSPYIGDILNVAFRDAHAIVVFFTPDDEARLREPLRHDGDPPHESELTGQARPNVLFEAGIAMGRDPDRTILVEMGQLRPFSDIAGRHLLRFDGSSQRRQELAQRLQSAGCPINLSGTDWHTAGDFESALALLEADSSQASVSNGQESENTPQHGLSDDAIELLIEASKDPQGCIDKTSTMGGLFVQTNGRQFVEEQDPKSEARWRHALNELIGRGLVEDNVGHDEVFQLTWPGHQVVGQLDA